MKYITTFGALTTFVVSINIQANQDVSGFYIGGGLGSTNIDTEENGLSFNSDTDGNTLKLIGGYQFNRIVAVEVQYTKYGDITPIFALQGYEWAPTTISLTANLGYTFENGLRPFGIIGLSSLDLGESVNNLDDNGAQAVRFGLGLEYTSATLAGVSFRVGYEGDAFTIDSGVSNPDVDVLLGSIYIAASYKF